MLRKEKPSFENFQDVFMEEIKKSPLGSKFSLKNSWLEVGDEALREEILNNFKAFMEKEYDVELVLGEALSMNKSIESIIISLYQAFSTVYIMERINDKIRSRKK